MKPSIAVSEMFQIFVPQRIKQVALLFDQIAMISAETGYLNADGLKAFPNQATELRWLVENGIVFEPPIPESLNVESIRDLDLSKKYLKESVQILVGAEVDLSTPLEGLMKLIADKKDFELSERMQFIGKAIVGTSYLTRVFSTNLRDEGFDAYPVLLTELPDTAKSSKQSLIQIVLKGLPMPDEETPWEQILEYRGDPDSKAKFLDLRHWMSEIARANLPSADMEEKLEYLISQYQRHLEIHRMKTSVGILETTLVSTGEIIENLVRIKWGKLAKMLFSFRERKLALLEGELTSPGSEIAYVIKARETFDH